MENMWRALEKVRNLLLRILNKQFLIFLFFLILSSVFWLIMTLNETYKGNDHTASAGWRTAQGRDYRRA